VAKRAACKRTSDCWCVVDPEVSVALICDTWHDRRVAWTYRRPPTHRRILFIYKFTKYAHVHVIYCMMHYTIQDVSKSLNLILKAGVKGATPFFQELDRG